MNLQSPGQESSVLQPCPALTFFQAEEEVETSPSPTTYLNLLCVFS